MIAFGGAAPLHAGAARAEARHLRECWSRPAPASARRSASCGRRSRSKSCTATTGRWPIASRTSSTSGSPTCARRRWRWSNRPCARAGRPRAGRRGALMELLAEVRLAELRYAGQGHELQIALPAGAARPGCAAGPRRALRSRIRASLRAAQRPIAGRGRDLAADAVDDRVAGGTVCARTGALPKRREPARATPGSPLPADAEPFGLHWRFDLKRRDRVAGPALIAEHETTTVVPADGPRGSIRRAIWSCKPIRNELRQESRDDDHPMPRMRLRSCSRSRSR